MIIVMIVIVIISSRMSIIMTHYEYYYGYCYYDCGRTWRARPVSVRSKICSIAVVVVVVAVVVVVVIVILIIIIIIISIYIYIYAPKPGRSTDRERGARNEGCSPQRFLTNNNDVFHSLHSIPVAIPPGWWRWRR